MRTILLTLILLGAPIAVTHAEEDAVVGAVAPAKGVEAARALLERVDDRDPGVRLEALRAVARLGLRTDALADALQEILADPRRQRVERLAALEALGAVGDGRDMASLLAITGSDAEPPETRAEAFRAMGAITGLRLPFTHARWSYWWRQKAAPEAVRMATALAGLQEDPRGAEVASLEAAIGSGGWADVVGVRTALDRWLRGSDRRLIPIACRLAAQLRLADLEPALLAASRGLQPEDIRIALAAAMGALGVVVEEGSR